MASSKPLPVRERLIQNGLLELNEHGIRDFSVRRVATQCGISCAAPYKHFSDKSTFIIAIIKHVIDDWEARIPSIIAQYPSDLRKQITELCLAYMHFLVENSNFRSIITLKNPKLKGDYDALKLRLSNSSRRLIYAYADNHGMPRETAEFKIYVVRSLIYGAALMFDNGGLEYNAQNIDYVRRAIDREFDLP